MTVDDAGAIGSKRPNLFIVGAPKSGTTSLYEYLEGHPAVFMSPVKEPFYFSPDVVTGPRKRYRYGDDELSYLSLFAGAGDETYVGEASTTYMVSRVAAGLVKEFQPSARVIALVRNPVQVIQAIHNERVSQGVEPLADFEDALRADADRRAGRRLPDSATPLGAVYRDTCKFGEQLERWINAFGRESVHVIVFDDFAADTAAEFSLALRFLQVDQTYQPATFAARNPSHMMRGGLVRRIIDSRAARVGRNAMLPAILGPDRAARLTRRFRHSRFIRRANPRADLPEPLRSHLEREFAPDVERLSALLGRDLVGLWFGRPA